MREVTNECVGCTSLGLHCIGSSCPNRNVVHYFCDICGEELEPDELYKAYGRELCAECILKDFEKIESEE